jgi:Ca2+-binding RTX toxin-like protein
MPGIRLGVLAVLSLFASALCFPAGASAELSCSYSPADGNLTIFVTADDTGLIRRSGDEIVVADAGGSQTPCANAPGGGATMTNVDRVRLITAGDGFAKLQLVGGPFAPGATLESVGFPEIEIDWISAGGLLEVTGTPLTNAFRWGANGGINIDPGLNGDRDVDVSPSGELAILIGNGLGGEDRLTVQSRRVDGIPFEEGGGGDDLLRTGRGGGVMLGGPGKDRLIGGRRFDLLSAGTGHDRIKTGRGGDLVLAADGARDFIFCGRGFDFAKVDPRDVVRGCEVTTGARSNRAAAAVGTESHTERLRRLSDLWAEGL